MRPAGIIERDGAVLLMHRIKGNRVYYVFPRGTVAEGETPRDACIRGHPPGARSPILGLKDGAGRRSREQT